MRRIYWWVGSSAALLTFWPSITHADTYGVPFRGHEEMFLPHLVLVLAHVVAGILLGAVYKRKQRLSLPDLLLIVLASEGMGMFLLMMTASPYSRFVLLGTVVISLLCYLAFYVNERLEIARLGSVGLSLLSLAAVATIGAALYGRNEPEARAPEEKVVDSAFYQLRLTYHVDRIPVPETRGGGMDAFEDGALLVTGDGKFYMAKVSDMGSGMETRELRLKAPLNQDEFYPNAPEPVLSEYFGVADLLVQRTPDLNRLFVSHHYWKEDQQCYVFRVSTTEWELNEVDPVRDGNPWQTLYETKPCIGFEADSLRPHQLMMSGGRMQLLNGSELLLTVGDHGFDKLAYGPLYAQTPDVSYGKIVRIRIDDGSAEIYSTGHRNPQGLYVRDDGSIWSTEHGPRGGDELNLIVQGGNYGWPFVTYGVDYDKFDYPTPDQPAPQDPLQLPVYSWVPSVGISNLIESRSSIFPSWNGDLLISSLRGRALYRVQMEDGRVAVIEPIPVGGRVRDLVEDSSGRLILWMDAGLFVVVAPSDGARSGSDLFVTHCAACHQVDDDGQHLLGPDLGGVFNDRIATAPNFRYSNTLKGLSGTWDEETLRKFLLNPREFAPGTIMDFNGISNDVELQRIVDYLKELQE